jgi:hypothetical protein
VGLIVRHQRGRPLISRRAQVDNACVALTQCPYDGTPIDTEHLSGARCCSPVQCAGRSGNVTAHGSVDYANQSGRRSSPPAECRAIVGIATQAARAKDRSRQSTRPPPARDRQRSASADGTRRYGTRSPHRADARRRQRSRDRTAHAELQARSDQASPFQVRVYLAVRSTGRRRQTCILCTPELGACGTVHDVKTRLDPPARGRPVSSSCSSAGPS